MRKLLIVDDSRDLLEAMKLFLEKHHFIVETLYHKQEIIPKVKTFHPDMIILDIFLEGEDGREICKELRKHAETKYLCIMMFSASPEALDNYGMYGADGCIEKPFGLNNIIQKIESVLNTCNN